MLWNGSSLLHMHVSYSICPRHPCAYTCPHQSQPQVDLSVVYAAMHTSHAMLMWAIKWVSCPEEACCYTDIDSPRTCVQSVYYQRGRENYLLIIYGLSPLDTCVAVIRGVVLLVHHVTAVDRLLLTYLAIILKPFTCCS